MGVYMKKILLLTYSKKNLGDDLFLVKISEKYPNKEFYYTAYIENNFLNFPNLHPLKLYNLFFILITIPYIIFSQFESIIWLGGSIFIESKSWKFLYMLRRLLILFHHKSKKFIIGSNFGPYNDPNFLICYKKFMLKMDDVCFRDRYSYNLFSDLNNIRLESDVVFGLNYTKTEFTNKTIAFSIINPKNISQIKSHTSYINYCKQAVMYFAKLGYTINLLSFCDFEGDDLFCNYLADELKNEKIFVVNYNGDYKKMLKVIEQAELLICTRFHSMILAALMRKNFICISYSKKINEYAKTFFRNSITIESIDENLKFIYKYNYVDNEILEYDILSAERQFLGFDKS